MNINKIIFKFCLLFLPLLVSLPALAEEKDAVKMGEVVVTATRYEEQLSSVPANISVISEDEIKGSTARNIPDLLRTQVGIQVNDIGGNRRNMTVDIRGFGETSLLNTLVLVDGRRVNIPDLSGTDWTLIPLDRVKKIEIIRGGRGSVLYGDNAAGGVINIITKEGGALKAGAEAAYGSYGTFKGSAYLSGSSNNISYSLNGSYLSSDGYRQNSDTEAKDLGTNINYYISDFLKLNLSAGYHKDDTRLPGALKESDFDAGHSRTDSITPDNYAKVEDYYFKAGPEFYFWKDSLAKIDASYRKRSFMSFASFAEGHFLADTDIVTLALSPQILLKHDIGKVKNTLSLGLDYTKAEENILNESLFFGMQSTGDLKFEKDSTGYYFHDEVGVTDDLLLSAGYRHDSAGFDFNPGTPDHTSMNEDLYTAGINYNYYKKCYTYFSLSRSFRYPIFDELFSYFTNTIDVSLDPQRSDDYELGIRHYFADNAYVHFNLFRIDTESEIFFNPLTFLNENLDAKSRRDGVEISVSGKPYDWLELNGSYTYMDAKIKGGSFAGKALPDVAHNKATAGVAVFPVKGLTVSLKGIFVGKRPFISDFANDFNKQSGYLIVNSKIKYEWKGLTAFLDINNLTDKEYSEYGVLGGFPVEKAFYPSPKRNFMAGLSFAF